MSRTVTDTVIIGAGPYGLSLAAHLRAGGRSLRILGAPMKFWSNHMPRGMCLKSEGFASDLYDPGHEFPLRAYCAEQGIEYRDIGLPVRIGTFIAYALEFQRRYVPELEDTQVLTLSPGAAGFELKTDSGETVLARRVVVAAGLMNFGYIPPLFAALPKGWVSHSSEHHDLQKFRDRRVAVIGAGASALDLAALLLEAGAKVELVARRSAIAFHSAPREPRSFLDTLKAPRSGLGTGWRSRMCTDAPLAFHAMPQSFRFRVVERHLGPAPGWFVRDAVVGRLPMHLRATMTNARIADDQVQLSFSQPSVGETQIAVDHVIAATGYRVDMSRLPFMQHDTLARLNQAEGTPILDRHFESSVRDLYVIGAAAANSFGPLLRFAYGAKFAAKRVAARLSSS
ncbi:MAG: NAD(P)-binding domain-containing protein [Candidatus Eremiobacteraeota bacterium]|nr:NAD(P)-binding domain-containing protein [Candidatus Eremiobacteraeota bacterium]